MWSVPVPRISSISRSHELRNNDAFEALSSKDIERAGTNPKIVVNRVSTPPPTTPTTCIMRRVYAITLNLRQQRQERERERERRVGERERERGRERREGESRRRKRSRLKLRGECTPIPRIALGESERGTCDFPFRRNGQSLRRHLVRFQISRAEKGCRHSQLGPAARKQRMMPRDGGTVKTAMKS